MKKYNYILYALLICIAVAGALVAAVKGDIVRFESRALAPLKLYVSATEPTEATVTGALAATTIDSDFAYVPAEVTVASGNYTLATPTKAFYEMTFSSSGGSFVFGETSVADGQILRVCNEGSNTFAIADSSGVSETAGALTVGQYDCYDFVYLSDRWAETGGSNN